MCLGRRRCGGGRPGGGGGRTGRAGGSVRRHGAGGGAAGATAPPQPPRALLIPLSAFAPSSSYGPYMRAEQEKALAHARARPACHSQVRTRAIPRASNNSINRLRFTIRDFTVRARFCSQGVGTDLEGAEQAADATIEALLDLTLAAAAATTPSGGALLRNGHFSVST